jgi:FkbM family methyltransferase
MKTQIIKRLSRRATQLVNRFRPDPDRFLQQVPGVIHVGANEGQERDTYDRHGLKVIWIEPIPEVFATLQAYLRDYPRQAAYQYLVTDRDDSQHPFHIASNSGASSSILDLKLHKDVWPDITYERTVVMRGTTLSSLLKRESIDPADYPALVMDVQGSELLVLKGAVDILSAFRFIKTEVPNFEAYAGCCQLADIEEFLTARGFREFSRRRFAEHPAGGSYFDIVYERRIS